MMGNSRRDAIDAALIKAALEENRMGSWSQTLRGLRNEAEVLYTMCKERGDLHAASMVLDTLVSLYDHHPNDRVLTPYERGDGAPTDRSGRPSMELDPELERVFGGVSNPWRQLAHSLTYAFAAHRDGKPEVALEFLDEAEPHVISQQAQHENQPWDIALLLLWSMRRVFTGSAQADTDALEILLFSMSRGDLTPLHLWGSMHEASAAGPEEGENAETV